MKLNKTVLGLGAAALIAGPAVAQVAAMPTIAPLSGDESELSGGSAIIIGLIGAAAVVGGILLASDSDDTQLPVSG
ncbi:hypothetical protein J3454_15625 [Erythrobacter sp. NFXS35]|uniref:hypothetical protein n=1 Tax=Erythrobacter sp. NFXS35 TaxID=2818436 RepID=UPI0032DF9B32